ncbi:uracil-DNA glycosylase-like protein [Syncephalastrum racemosum]|uniref:Uracil-DNA glycosylase n=1 Tax=Syncephalastrum racemosum TaxID=13706 RepID=A0A1X2HQA7_SYNRA|nr:uracil-DNA glycosylase-like protein [Syncephalastrum racemosum]
MENSNKRPFASTSTTTDSKSPAKKQVTRQVSLLSMFKPKESTSASSTVDNLQVTETRDPAALFKNLDDESKARLDLEIKNLRYEWLKVLKDELTKPYFLELKKFLKDESSKYTIYPPDRNIYTWSHCPPNNVKVVIIGQDPYHNENQAHGLCFSVVKGVKVPPSLVNIYSALQKDYPDFKKPNHGYLDNWVKEGVLLLNACLTVRAHNANSHADHGWEKFTDAVIKHLNEKKSHVVFMLWGSYAQKKGAKIDSKKHLVLKSVHPSPLSAHRGFFDCGHFKKANEYLRQNAREPVNWNCLDD